MITVRITETAYSDCQGGVDGTPVSELVCTSFDTWLAGKQTVTATVRRGDETIEVVLAVVRKLEDGAASARGRRYDPPASAASAF